MELKIHPVGEGTVELQFGEGPGELQLAALRVRVESLLERQEVDRSLLCAASHPRQLLDWTFEALAESEAFLKDTTPATVVRGNPRASGDLLQIYGHNSRAWAAFRLSPSAEHPQLLETYLALYSQQVLQQHGLQKLLDCLAHHWVSVLELTATEQAAHVTHCEVNLTRLTTPPQVRQEVWSRLINAPTFFAGGSAGLTTPEAAPEKLRLRVADLPFAVLVIMKLKTFV